MKKIHKKYNLEVKTGGDFVVEVENTRKTHSLRGGTEINALKGEEKLIKTYKLKLAIYVYHKKEDIWEIPRLILGYVLKYNLYLRHYFLSKDESVLYFIPE